MFKVELPIDSLTVAQHAPCCIAWADVHPSGLGDVVCFTKLLVFDFWVIPEDLALITSDDPWHKFWSVWYRTWRVLSEHVHLIGMGLTVIDLKMVKTKANGVLSSPCWVGAMDN